MPAEASKSNLLGLQRDDAVHSVRWVHALDSFLRWRGQPYHVYLLRRPLRIYAPHVVASGLAVVSATVWHSAQPLGDRADETSSQPFGILHIPAHVVMIGNYDWPQFNTAFLSLAVETAVSIIWFLFWLVPHPRAEGAVPGPEPARGQAGKVVRSWSPIECSPSQADRLNVSFRSNLKAGRQFLPGGSPL